MLCSAKRKSLSGEGEADAERESYNKHTGYALQTLLRNRSMHGWQSLGSPAAERRAVTTAQSINLYEADFSYVPAVHYADNTIIFSIDTTTTECIRGVATKKHGVTALCCSGGKVKFCHSQSPKPLKKLL